MDKKQPENNGKVSKDMLERKNTLLDAFLPAGCPTGHAGSQGGQGGLSTVGHTWLVHECVTTSPSRLPWQTSSLTATERWLRGVAVRQCPPCHLIAHWPPHCSTGHTDHLASWEKLLFFLRTSWVCGCVATSTNMLQWKMSSLTATGRLQRT